MTKDKLVDLVTQTSKNTGSLEDRMRGNCDKTFRILELRIFETLSGTSGPLWVADRFHCMFVSCVSGVSCEFLLVPGV